MGYPGIKKIISFIAMALVYLSALPTLSYSQLVLKMNHQFPATTPGSQIDQWFADQIFEQTQGRVKIRIFWSNGLAAPQENLSLLKSGIIDMAGMSAGYYPEELSFFAAPNSIPMGMDDVCQSSEIMSAFLQKIPAFEKEAADHQIKPLFFHVLNPYLLVTKTPITAFSDLKGLRIRTWGKDMPRMVEAAGATAVKLFLPDIRPALDHGVIDGCPFSLDLMVSYKIYEIAKHVTQVVLWEGPSWGVWISHKAWKAMSTEDKKIFNDTASAARQLEIPKLRAAEASAKQFLIKNGVVFHTFDQQELKKWKDANPDFFNDLIEQMAKKGQKKDAEKMVDLWKSMRDEIKCSSSTKRSL